MIINQDLKNIYKTFIDEIISSHGLTNQCSLYYDNKSDYCSNCIFDKSTEMSSNVYNTTGPSPFDDYTMCPVCMGSGKVYLEGPIKQLYVAVIFDSKYFLNIKNKLVNIPEGTIQIICSKAHSQDLKSCSYLVFDNYLEVKYERIDDINLSGLGDLEYIFMNWRRV